jgi:DNA repair exonuclease SbcCD ATPase subunit
MRLRRSKTAGRPSGSDRQQVGGARGSAPGRPRLQRAEQEIAALRRRVAALEKEVQEARHLNKRLAEITDVVAEVLLPAEDRDEERLRALLQRYDAQL